MSSCDGRVKTLKNVIYYTTQINDTKYAAGKYDKGDIFTIDMCETVETNTGDTQYWVRNSENRKWSILADDSATYIKVLEDNGNPPLFSGNVIQESYTNEKGKLEYVTIAPETYDIQTLGTYGGTLTIEHTIPTKTESVEFYHPMNLGHTNPSTVNVVPPGGFQSEAIQQNNNLYPPTLTIGKNITYDYTVRIQSDLREAFLNIKRDLNVPSAYTRLELNKLFNDKFNRFRAEFPDYFLNNTLGYCVITRPDLNLFANDGSLHPQISNDPQLYYISKANPMIPKSLTKNYSTEHHFIPLLSNTITSLDVADESIDTLETGETFTGFKTQYAKSNIRSMTAGTIGIKFPETYNMGITHTHQMWCSYESGVYRGILKPKDQYIWSKILDYASDIYYFIVDAEDMIIRYWCKYVGCFPLNVNKSIFSYDAGSQVSHPDINVTYAYFARDDMNPITLTEFNNNSGGLTSSFRYKANFIPSKGISGNTWSNAPFVQGIKVKTGFLADAELFALRFREYNL